MPGPLDELLGRSPLRDPARGRRAGDIAALVRTTLRIPEDIAITVQQLSCREPGCPPVETVIAVLGTPSRRWTIHRRIAEIDDAAVVGVLANDPAHDHDSMETT
ncbi:hypothetical protein K1T35_37200 [Pseudonocardia sp. DSM 110487]|uniref:hypothetical protein n=1 Tax=Pseudonocardia sp. DSM 110487 TaxID=2865833 RepID=UPI001C69D21F|nr:hypothetical protein [Pseudonocardia sp. DSM 110487]QYN34033.1 hypothetical protein K1T35_37200 [Pseudonocardia sp. DSM 110487]